MTTESCIIFLPTVSSQGTRARMMAEETSMHCNNQISEWRSPLDAWVEILGTLPSCHIWYAQLRKLQCCHVVYSGLQRQEHDCWLLIWWRMNDRQKRKVAHWERRKAWKNSNFHMIWRRVRSWKIADNNIGPSARSPVLEGRDSRSAVSDILATSISISLTPCRVRDNHLGSRLVIIVLLIQKWVLGYAS